MLLRTKRACCSCRNVNWARRGECNQCGTARPYNLNRKGNHTKCARCADGRTVSHAERSEDRACGLDTGRKFGGGGDAGGKGGGKGGKGGGKGGKGDSDWACPDHKWVRHLCRSHRFADVETSTMLGGLNARCVVPKSLDPRCGMDEEETWRAFPKARAPIGPVRVVGTSTGQSERRATNVT